MQGRELQKRQALLDRAFHQLTLVGVDSVPFVDRHHDSTSTLEDVSRDVCVLFRHALGGVEQEQNHMGAFDGLKRFHHREFFDGFKHLSFSAQTCGVDQFEAGTLPLERHRNRVSSGSWQIERNQAFLPQPSIDQGRFAHVGSACDGQTNHAIFFWGLIFVFRQVQKIQRHFSERTNALPV